MNFFDDERDSKRTLSKREKEYLYLRANKKCESCGKKIDFLDMEVGHKTSWAKGGKTTLRNSVCLCHSCNRLQGTDKFSTHLRKLGLETPKAQMKKSLQALTLGQLKALASKHKIKVTGRVVEDFFDSRRVAPTKSQYINKLAGVVSEEELKAIPKESPKPLKKKR